MRTRISYRNQKGFTLIEMLVTITIIVILAGLSLGGFNFVANKQANETAKVQISLLANALEEYKLDNGTFPSGDGTDGSTTALYTSLYQNGVASGNPEEIYLSDLDPNNDRQKWIESSGGPPFKILDPWRQEYIYRDGSDANAKNPDFDLISKGKDGTLGTPDDITN